LPFKSVARFSAPRLPDTRDCFAVYTFGRRDEWRGDCHFAVGTIDRDRTVRREQPMRRAVVIAIIVALIAGSGGLRVVAAQQGGVKVNGRAVRTDMQSVVSGTVRLRRLETGMVVGTATTTENGAYSFDGVRPGRYVLELLDSDGRLLGVTAPFVVGDDDPVAVSIVAGSTGVMATSQGAAGFSLLGLGTVATVAVLGAAGAAAVTGVVATRQDASPSR
jgi:hypothetical protein